MRWKKWTYVCACILVFTIGFNIQSSAQEPLMQCKVGGGKMLITLSKVVRETALDSFIAQYNLGDLKLKDFILTGRTESLLNAGWQIEMNNAVGALLSKPLKSGDDLSNPAERIIFTNIDENDFETRFPVVSSGVRYGFNRFKNKHPFLTRDSLVTFFIRGHQNARRVILAGSFSNWSPDAIPMTKTDSGWIAVVALRPGKYWYKYITDGDWHVDTDNSLQENDGLGNMNSVMFKTNYVFKLDGHTNAKKVSVAGSFNNWRPSELLMNKTPTGWELPLYLSNGTHTYRFLADGKWFSDPANPDRFPNEFGEFNSVIHRGTKTRFYLSGYPNAKQVVLKGSFNGWRDNELFMKKMNTGWEIEYALGPGNYEYRFVVDKKEIEHKGETDYSFVLEANYTFRLNGFEKAKEVFIAGDFNNWSEKGFPMKRVGNQWVFSVHLTRGKHLYKFIVDGEWIIDPGNKLWEQNQAGTGNSVIWVQ
jgi:hypothetical protein